MQLYNIFIEGREGLEGLDPRFIINIICSVLVKRHKKCLSVHDFLKALKTTLKLLENINSLTNH